MPKEEKKDSVEVFKFMDGWFGNITDVLAVLVILSAIFMLMSSSGSDLQVEADFNLDSGPVDWTNGAYDNEQKAPTVRKAPTVKQVKTVKAKTETVQKKIGRKRDTWWFADIFDTERDYLAEIANGEDGPIDHSPIHGDLATAAKKTVKHKPKVAPVEEQVEEDTEEPVETVKAKTTKKPTALEEETTEIPELNQKTIWEGWNDFDNDIEPMIKDDDSNSETFKSALNWLSGFLATEDVPFFVEKEQQQAASKECTNFVGIDDTHTEFCAQNCPDKKCPPAICACATKKDTNIACANNRYKTREKSSFLCQASCNQAPFLCPSSLCECESADQIAEKRCASPLKCNSNTFIAVPGTVASDQWCNQACNKDDGYCPCTLCECSITCSTGISNGDFKGLDGWNVLRQKGSKGDIKALVAGAVAPATGKELPVLENNDGSVANIAVFDQSAPGSYALYQEYVPVKGDVLSFQWFVHNFASNFYIQPDTMAANVFRNQQFRVDLVDPTNLGSLFDLDSRVLENILSAERAKSLMNALGQPPLNSLSPWQTIRVDLSKYAGQKVALVFRSVHNQGIMNVGLANVKIVNRICTPSLLSRKGELKPVTATEFGSLSCGEMCQQAYAHN